MGFTLHTKASLGNKLTILVFATVIATLALVGGAFWWMTDTFHEAQARAKILDSTRALQFELRLAKTALAETAQRLAIQDDVLSSANLIHSYEDPQNYQPLVFDVEKRQLASRLNQALASGQLALVAAYTPDGRVTAFSIMHGGHPTPGFSTYSENGTPQFVIIDNTRSNAQLMAFAPPQHLFINDFEPAARAGRTVIRSLGAGMMMDFTTPVLRERPDGRVQNLGWIRTVRILDGAFFSTLGGQTGVRIHYIPNIHDARFADRFSADTPVLALRGDTAPTFAWSVGQTDYAGALLLHNIQGEPSALVLKILKEDMLAGLAAFRDAAIVVLVLASMLFVPAMLYFMRTNITHPLNALVDSAMRIKNGERVAPAGAHRGDEIGALARAFDVMAETVQKREQELAEKQKLLDGVVNNAPSLIQVKDAKGRYALVNNRWERFFGKSLHEVHGKSPFDVLPATTAMTVHTHDDDVITSRAAHQFEEELQGVDSTRTFMSIKFPLVGEDGDVYGICGISQDITERKKAEERLRLTQRVVDETVEGIMITDADQVIVDVNPAFTTITGYTRDEVIGHTPTIMTSGRHDQLFYKEMWNELRRTGQWTGEIWDRRKNGEVYPKWLSIAAIYGDSGHVSHYVGVFSDITKVKETERQLEHMAHYDGLTGLPNRILFQDRLRRALARHRRHGHKGALMFIDLDRFKQVNDTLGHEKGDELLIEATARLLDCVREDDTVARLGGDEFTVVLNSLENETRAHDVAERIIHRLEDPFDLSGNEVFVSASIGIVFFPGDGNTIEELTRNADMAMYEAKSKGRATFQFFNAGMNERIRERMALETGLRAASLNEELRLMFQPKYDLNEGRVTSTEALVRWQHPERGLLSPDKFIPLAEETGLILDIGRWVLYEACRQTRRWMDEYDYRLPVAINLSARQFTDPALSENIRHALRESRLDPDMLIIEVTESMVMDDVDKAIEVLRRLKRLGLTIAIDDFGTGYSSLNQLRKLPVDELKIDRSFVCDIPNSTEDMEIVSAVISMAKSLRLSVVAEGVETLEQLDFLREQGCSEAQGYLIGKPVDGLTLPLYLNDDGPNTSILAEQASKGKDRTLQ